MYKLRYYSIIGGIVISLIFLFSVAAQAREYTDIEGHFASRAIRLWSEREILEGYQNQFRPNDPVTRGELAVILNRLLRMERSHTTIGYSDVKESFYKEAILTLVEQGILLGSDGRLRPEEAVSRQEAALILARIFPLEEGEGEASFADEREIAAWAKEAMLAMAKNGFMKGYDDRIHPKKTLTRGELAVLLDNMITGYIDQSGEYEEKDVASSKGFLFLRAGEIALKNLQSSRVILISADNKMKGLYLKNVKAEQLRFFPRQATLYTLLENSSFQSIKGQTEAIELFADKASRIGDKVIQAASLAEGKKKLAEAKIFLATFSQMGLSDEYAPNRPKTPNISQTEEIIPIPSVPKLWVMMEGLAEDGKIYLPAQKQKLPSKAPIAEQDNGENTGTALELAWSGQGIAAIEAGIAGEYILTVEIMEDFSINQREYRQVKLPVTIVIGNGK